MSSNAIYVVNTYKEGVGADKRWSKHGSLYKAVNDFVVPSQRRYAERCGVDYVELKDEPEEYEGNPYHSACLRNVTMFKDFAESQYERILFLDCDILISENASNIFEDLLYFSAGGIDAKKAKEHQEKVLESSLNVRVPSGYFFCTGVAMYPREVFEAYAKYIDDELISAQANTLGFFDMHGCGYLNYKINKVPDLISRHWHCMPPMAKEDTNFVHYGGGHKIDLIKISNSPNEEAWSGNVVL